jgi:cytochrome c-type protein NapB
VAAVLACAESAPDAERAAYRAAQRAFEGAPPVIPHPVRALNRQDCLSCHKDGMELPGEGVVPRTPHPENRLCEQCHVEQLVPGGGLARNSFVGLRYAERGERAYRGAPPTIPHLLSTRQNCLGCHGAYGGSPIRSPHPDRVNCMQCHVAPLPLVPVWRENRFGGGR